MTGASAAVDAGGSRGERGLPQLGLRALVLLGAPSLASADLALRPAGNHRLRLDAELVAAASPRGHGDTLDLPEVADFDWDRAAVFAAYSDLATFEQGLGFRWSPQSWARDRACGSTFLLPNDGLQLLVLVRGDRHVAGWCTLNQDHQTSTSLRFDFGADRPQFLAFEREAARFEVRDVRADFEGRPERAWLLAPRAPR